MLALLETLLYVVTHDGLSAFLQAKVLALCLYAQRIATSLRGADGGCSRAP